MSHGATFTFSVPHLHRMVSWLQWCNRCCLERVLVKLPDNELEFQTLDELIGWTSSYFHFKQALEVIGLTPVLALEYIETFESFADRLAQDLTRQRVLESSFPKEMREKILADKPHLAVLREILEARAQGKDPWG